MSPVYGLCKTVLVLETSESEAMPVSRGRVRVKDHAHVRDHARAKGRLKSHAHEGDYADTRVCARSRACVYVRGRAHVMKPCPYKDHVRVYKRSCLCKSPCLCKSAQIMIRDLDTANVYEALSIQQGQ